MNFSTIYLLYPENKTLERSIASNLGMLSEELIEAAYPDRQAAVVDNFLFTRGNFEQHAFSTSVFEYLIEALEGALCKQYRTQEPLAWGEKQNHLGNILAALGQQRRDAEAFDKAFQCFANALEEYDQESAPHEWASTHYNLATANQAYGRLFDDPKSLKSAVDAYTNALLVWSREESAEDWMSTMHQLGATFHAYGKHLNGNRTFQKSVVAYKNALALLDADNYPLELTATHNNRAAVLHHLAESEGNPERLKEAIKSYEKALCVSMEQQLPLHVAVICRVNKATACNVLAEKINDVGLAEEIGDEFEVIIECFSHVLQPLCLTHCKEQMEKSRSLALAIS